MAETRIEPANTGHMPFGVREFVHRLVYFISPEDILAAAASAASCACRG